jgi:hypothetical protein
MFRSTAVDGGSKLTVGPLVSGFPSNIFFYIRATTLDHGCN